MWDKWGPVRLSKSTLPATKVDHYRVRQARTRPDHIDHNMLRSICRYCRYYEQDRSLGSWCAEHIVGGRAVKCEGGGEVRNG